MKTIIRFLIVCSFFFLMISCEKEKKEEPLNISNLVKRKITSPIIRDYKYDNLGRLIQVDSTDFYSYSDSIIEEFRDAGPHGSSTNTKHFLNSNGLVYKSISYYIDRPTDTSSFYIYFYYYDSARHLIRQNYYRGYSPQYNYYYVWQNDNIHQMSSEFYFEGTAYFDKKFEYTYYGDKLNNRSFGFDRFGLTTKNLVKQINKVGTEDWEKYRYQLDEHQRPIKQIYTEFHVRPYDIDSSTSVTDYEYY